MTNFSHNFAGAGAVIADSVTVTGTVTAGAIVGPLTGNTTGTHTGPVATDSLTIDGVLVPAPPPNTSAELLAQTGLTGVSAWRLDQVVSTGNVASFGDTATTLATIGSPTMGHPLAATSGGVVRGMYFDAATTDGLSVAGLDPAATSFIAGARIAFVSDPGGSTHFAFGRVKGGATNLGWGVRITDAGDIVPFVGDAAGTDFSFTLAAAALTLTSPPVEVIVQLDRSGADPVLRARCSRNGRTLGSGSVTCTDLGTLTSAGVALAATSAALLIGWMIACEVTRRRHQRRHDERRRLAEMRRVLGQGRDDR